MQKGHYWAQLWQKAIDPDQLLTKKSYYSDIDRNGPRFLDSDAYISEGKQKNASAYKKMIARLPAPPSGETLEDLYPEVALEWDYETNLPLTPALFSVSSEQKVSWVCTKGHHWNAMIKSRTQKGSGCPICYASDISGIVRRGRARNTVSLAQGNPAYLAQYDDEKNGFPPTEIALKSGMKVWWRCENGHSYQKTPVEMVKNSSCPVCNSLPFAYPEIVKQWDYEKKGLPPIRWVVPIV